MKNYISANTAAARTETIRFLNEKKIEKYKNIGKHFVFPILMKQIMKGIEKAINAGEGEFLYKFNSEQFITYSKISIETGLELVENKMFTLGYRIIQMDNYTYKFVWLSN